MNKWTARSVAFATALFLMGGAAAGFSFTVRQLKLYLVKLPIEAEAKLSVLPRETASWKQFGQDQRMEEAMVQELGTENYISRNYIQKSPAPKSPPVSIDVHLAYYTGMVDTVPHIPDRCLVAAGWSIAGDTQIMKFGFDPDALNWQVEPVPEERGTIYTARFDMNSDRAGSRIRLPRDVDQMALRVNPYIYPGNKQKLFAGYMFLANGGHTASTEGVRQLAFSLTDDYAYYMKVQFSSMSVPDEQAFVHACSNLLAELLPDIMRCAPDWVSVLRGEYPEGNPRKAARAAAAPSPKPKPRN